MAVRFVRPRRASAYGTGDGRSYANAWNGLASIVWGELNETNISSTLWVAGTHFERLDFVNGGSLTYAGNAFRDAARKDGLVVRGDVSGDRGVIDVRSLTYAYLSRVLTDEEIRDLTRWLAGSNDTSGAYCASVHFRAARNVTIRQMAIYGSKVALAETLEMNPAITAEANGDMLVYEPNTSPRPCLAQPYNGASILYPLNECIVSDLTARNLRVTECRIMGDGKVSRKGVALRAFANASRILIDRNDISGFLRGVQTDAAGQTLARVAVRVRRNKIHDLGFAAYDNFAVDGVRVIGDFTQSGCHAEVVANDISGYTKNAVDASAGPGTLVKANFCHDQVRQVWNYGVQHSAWGNGSTPIDNANESASKGASGIVGAASGLVIANTLYNAGFTHGISGSGRISRNLIVTDQADTGANGINAAGAAADIEGNTVVGYKRAARLASNGHKVRNNILARGTKSGSLLNAADPAGDLVVVGSSGHETSNNCYASASANKVVSNGGVLPGSDAGSLLGTDPKFRKPAKGDYRLREDSPCLGTGTFPGFYGIDANGTPVRLPPDMGALGRHAYMVLPREFLDRVAVAPDPAIPDPGAPEPPPPGGDPEPVPLPTLTNLSPAAFPLEVGQQATLQVAISAAQQGATVVTIANSNTSRLQAPSSVTVLAGATTAGFSVTGLAAGAVTLTASLNNTSRQATITVEAQAPEPPPPSGFGTPNFEPSGRDFLHSFESSVTEGGHWSIQAASSSRVTNPVVPDTHGARCVQLRTAGSDTNVNGSGSGERCDLSNRGAEGLVTAGREQYWAHSVRFPSNGFQRGNSWFVWWQWHAAAGGTQPTYSLHFPANSNSIRLRVHGGQAPSGLTHQQTFFSNHLLDTWYDFIEHFVWSPSSNTGRTRVWCRRRGVDAIGQLMCDVRGPNMYNGDAGNYLKPSCYHGDQISGGTAIQHDRISRGPSLASVQWFDLEGV